MKLRALLWAGLCFAGGQANAGLFNDDEARHQIQQVESRVSKVEETGRQQAETIGQQIETSRQLTETNRQLTETSRQLTEASTQLTETSRQQTRSMLDLQAQIEAQNAELRSLRGQNEELVHNLQDAEKRQKDFYIDLDTRLRHFESIEAANAAAPPPPPPPPPLPLPPPDKTTDAGLAADDPALENRAYEAAHSLFKAGNHQKAITAFQELLKKFPESVYVPNANHEMGNAYFALKDYKNALTSYQVLVNKYSFSPKVPDAMLSIAYCQQELKDVASAKITLKQIIAKYPGSETADKAKERLTALK